MKPMPGYSRIRGVFLCAGVAAIFTLASFAAADPALAGGRMSKADRQVRTAERVLDEMLIDSPNFLVPGRDDARGVYLEGMGAVFTFTATLTGYHWRDGRSFSIFGSHFYLGKSGKRHITIHRSDSDDEDIEIRVEKEPGDKSWTLKSEDYEKDAQKKYDRGKDEMMQTLMDFGDILKALPSGTPVVLVGLLHDMDLPDDREDVKVVMKAKLDDLKAYADGSLSESQLKSRITVTES